MDQLPVCSLILAAAERQVQALPGMERLCHPKTTAAALLVARATSLLQPDGTWLGTVSATAKPRALTTDHPVINAQRQLALAAGEGWSDRWMYGLIRLIEIGADMSVPQHVDVLKLLLSGAVEIDGDQFMVHSSRSYTGTVTDGDYMQGFTCTCKAYFSNGAGNTLCKHVLAASVAWLMQSAASQYAINA